jgi:lipoate-protein ligase A
MARDSALLEAAENGQPGFRLYGWDGPWVSLGRFQKPAKALRAESGVPWVMRPTGGKAVLHGHDVTLGAAFPFVALGLKESETRSVAPAYRAIIRPLVAALRDSGANVLLGEETQFVKSGGATPDCFAHLAPNDVIDPETGRKVMGCALQMGRRAVLVQCSMPVGEPLIDPNFVFSEAHFPSWIKDLDREEFLKALRTRLTEALASQ